MNRPQEHLAESQKLTADAIINLYEIRLRTEPVTIRVCDSTTRFWQGNTYEQFGIQVTGEKRSADDEETRPRLQIINPEGVFSSMVRRRLLDRATVIRRRVLLQHIEEDVPIYQQRMWYVSRISDVTAGQSITMEMRHMSEGPNSRLPARQFIPPEFPMVRIK
ncbi:hypothetical protein JYP52_01440 [Nitratireductor aquibiodomus]|uniref:hypothetical protein n=1 Tax=Nitratireductor TaxID=245876 RepID=UPI0019D36464|nr:MULTISPECIES: hypothetical protein [Nitratireductor]MBN7759786.1 hypothetical protein [Nitratireductor aquibiodomus]MCV0350187.1 hypothetical protein [Nitratireductor sp.]MDV2968715.1 hypothetical protein [Nitratireductor aquimarinus]